MQTEQLESGQFYHIYNRGIDGYNLFRNEANYLRFLALYDKYVSPVADTYAWVLMPNHFHFLLRIKENVRYKYSDADRSNDAVWFEEHKWETTDVSDLSAYEVPDCVKIGKMPKTHLHLSHLMNAYSKYFNTQFDRHGALFERAFKRKHIENESYLKQVILYIHNNPVHHGFCSHPVEYPWSSYLTCISVKKTRLKRDEVIGWFDSEANFKGVHNEKVEIEMIEKILELD